MAVYRSFHKLGIPKNGELTMENPIEIDYGVPPFMETAMDPPSDPQGKTCLVDLLE